MPDTPSITIVKKFTYRGAPEEYSNRYHFSGTTPSSEADWLTLANAIIAEEKKIVYSAVSFVRAYGYEAGNENSVVQLDYSAAPLTPAVGTYSVGAGFVAPGDVAATTRWYTGQISSRGKKVYCRKYWHGVVHSNSALDQLETAQKTAMNTYAAKLIDGTLPGNFRYCGPQGAALSVPQTSQWLTTRTLKRRGRRPLP